MNKLSAFLSLICFLFCNCFAALERDVCETTRIEAIAKITRDFKGGCKTQLTELRGGLSGAELYTFEVSGKKYVLKVALKTESQLRRVSELQMHKFCSSRGIAPRLVFVDDEENPFIVVMEYIDGRLFRFSDFQNKEIMDKVIGHLRNIHAAGTELCLTRVSMMEEASHFIEQLKQGEIELPSEFDNWRQSLFESYKGIRRVESIPTHGDLWTKNILIAEDERVYFIDFQESRYDDPLCDLAYFLYGSGLEDFEDIKAFTSKYLGEEADEDSLKRVLFYVKASAFINGLYRFLWIRDVKTSSRQLDEILSKVERNASFYYQMGDYSKEEFDRLELEDKLKYVLGFFKSFLEIDAKLQAR
ncbi:MAG: phosphotransferase [Holosporales bacterium]|jgi:thiamine kinase-like enzyme|nr:phosphotransferase [Holosporales bacterium]